jgi:hypothetical protein
LGEKIYYPNPKTTTGATTELTMAEASTATSSSSMLRRRKKALHYHHPNRHPNHQHTKNNILNALREEEVL